METQNLQKSERIFCVYTTGCPASDAAVNIIKKILYDLGVRITNSIDKATHILYRPCTFEQSQIELSQKRIKDLIDSGKIVILLGCVVPLRDWCNEHNILVCENPNFKEFFIKKFSDEIGKAANQIVLPTNDEIGNSTSQILQLTNRVSITQGCMCNCAYCNIRNVEYGKKFTSIPEENIFRWIETLVNYGYNTIHLCGDDVTPYGYDNGKGLHGLPRLLLEIKDKYPELKIIITNLNIAFAKYWSDREVKSVVDCVGNLHLPIQSGDDDILMRMRRRYKIADFFRLCELITKFGGSVSTDCIVGFPGETDEQFNKTLEIVQSYCLKFLQAFAFGPVLGTLAAKMPNQISEETKLDRLTELVYWAIKMNPEIIINTNRE